MKKLMNSVQMKKIDEYSIQEVGVPSLVLMERAALCVTEAVLEKIKKTDKVLCVCGSGNNGADGMAVARQLTERGISAEVYTTAEEEKGTEELKRQRAILQKLGIAFVNDIPAGEYNCIIDAVFGIGLSRAVTGRYEQVIAKINAAKDTGSLIVAVDTPSGINAGNGQVMGCAVKADMTVTFGFAKCGLCLYPGRTYAGELRVANAGFADVRTIPEIWEQAAFTMEDTDIAAFFNRPADTNKGSYGKLLIVAGSENMAGAAALSAKAAYRTGCGLVKVFTHENNRTVVLTHVPEAVMVTYKDATDVKEKLAGELDWADCVVAGPGLSKSDTAKEIIAEMIAYQPKEGKRLPVILDADALNIIAENRELLSSIAENEDSLDNITDNKKAIKESNIKPTASKQYVYTPHMGEAARLSGKSIAQLKETSCESAKELAERLHGICVLKDAATVVSDGRYIYINTSGNSGMSTAGSGDTLTGILAGAVLAKQTQYTFFEKVCMGVYLHGRAGDAAAQQFGNAGMKAMDIADAVANVLKDNLDIF